MLVYAKVPLPRALNFAVFKGALLQFIAHIANSSNGDLFAVPNLYIS